MQSTLLCLLFYPHMFVLSITQTGHAYNISEELLQGTLNHQVLRRHWHPSCMVLPFLPLYSTFVYGCQFWILIHTNYIRQCGKLNHKPTPKSPCYWVYRLPLYIKLYPISSSLNHPKCDRFLSPCSIPQIYRDLEHHSNKEGNHRSSSNPNSWQGRALLVGSQAMDTKAICFTPLFQIKG